MALQQLSTPEVSIIMPAYNAEKTICESIDSVLAQTFANWELIVVDDASTDNTAEVVQGFADKDSRIRFFANESNQGAAVARNVGMGHANGKYIAFLDSDDLWTKDKLTKQHEFMQQTNAEISHTATSYIYEGTQSSFILHAKEKLTYSGLLKRNIMSCSSVMVRRDCMIEFPQGYMHEDYVVWLQIVKKFGHAYGIDVPLLVYRMGTATKSSKRIGSAVMVRNSYRQVGYGPVVSTVFMVFYAFHSISKRARIGLGEVFQWKQ